MSTMFQADIISGKKKTKKINTEIIIENLKCGGCAATIKKGI